VMHGREKSDSAIVAMKPANNAGQPAAEWVERRAGTEGNMAEPRTRRTPSRESVPQGLDRVRQTAKARKKERFTALLHHMSVDLLRDAYFWLKRNAAPGVDGVTWQEYAQDLEANLVDLHARARTERYRRGGSTSPNRMGGNARSALLRWKTKSFSARWWKCSMQSTKKTSWGSRTGSDLGAASTMRWMHSRRELLVRR
jgi:hypothetical protein